MIRFEYKVIPAPLRGLKGKGVKGNDGKFAHALEQVMNDMGRDGWEYQRAETLPSEERAGLTSKTTTFRNVLVFRRPVQSEGRANAPDLPDAPVPEPELEPEIEHAESTEEPGNSDAHAQKPD
ncbi:MAG: DUF4177 domain-containing protein [Planktotalea sp.]|uniref:DUF4177 domain-containing protein n=1 Tax=Planktotalea sp. TaxID=2029877 RepID=UPI003C74B05A